MTVVPAAGPTLRDRLLLGGLRGLVVRTPHHQVIEVLAASATPPDVVMIDTEHAAIGPHELDAMLAMALAHRLDALVRVPSLDGPWIQVALDAGAIGVVVPHVRTPEQAERAARRSHYGDGGRGFSGSCRSAGWGTRSMAEVLDEAAARTVVVAQLEDPDALEHVDAVVRTPGIDAVFVGTADLAVATGARSLADPMARAAADRVVDATLDAGSPLVAYAGSPTDAARWRARGAALVLEGSDQTRLAVGWD